jgi:iron complex outermembrane receptor protein
MFKLKALFILIALMVMSISGRAEEGDKAFYLDEIIVTATRTEQTLRDVPMTVSVLTRADLEASDINSSTDILSVLPGVFVWKSGPFGRSDVYIRGIGQRGRRMSVLIDGRPTKMSIYGCTVTHALPLSNVERIEVVRGPLSVPYGSDALGGVVNIITREVERGFDSDVMASYGSDDTRKVRLRHGGNVSNLNYYLTGDLRQTDGHLPNAAYDGRDFTARIGYELLPNVEASILAKYFDGRKEEPLEDDPWNDYERGAVDLNLSGKWENWEVDAKLYRNFGEHEFSDGWHSKDVTNGAVLHAVGRLFDRNKLITGMEFRQQDGESLNDPVGQWDKYDYGLFIHDEYTPVDKLTLTLGARYSVDEIAGSDISPEFGLVARPREGTIVRSSVSKGFRFPAINELYLFPPSHTDLKPEIAWNYEAGISQRIARHFFIDMVGFLIDGKDLIETGENSEPPPKFKFFNSGEFSFRGFEGGVSAQIKGLYTRLSYSYLDTEDKTQGRPGDEIDLYTRYRWRKLLVSLTGQYVADYFAANNREIPIDAFLVVNSYLSYEVFPGLRAFLAVDNITNQKYSIFVNLPGTENGLVEMPGISLSIGMKYALATGQ